MPLTVGVLAVQGDYAKHFDALARCKVNALEVRTPEDLKLVDRLIIPGGESTTVGLLLERYGLGDGIKSAAKDGMPIWGTCMGMILLASQVEDRVQYTLSLLDITVRRNAFGAQIHSFEDEVEVAGLSEPVTAIFIRAPVVTRLGEGVEAISTYKDETVAVRQQNLVGTSFHPELTEDDRFHRWFLGI
jgi:5'-phosphate synthase pdxT subunit